MMRTILWPALILSLALCAAMAGGPLPLTGVNIAGGEFYKPQLVNDNYSFPVTTIRICQ